jgi:hypothetical protein
MRCCWRAAPSRYGLGLTIAQVQYDGGGDWYANPSGLPNLLSFIADRTGMPVATRPARVRLTDPSLRTFPYLYLTGHGNIRLSEAEVVALRRYLDGGGFLHADDNYGLDESFRREMRRVFPDTELVDVPYDHPVYHAVYRFDAGLPKIHEHDGGPAQGLGIFRGGGWWCSTATSRTWATAGRTPRSTAIRRSSGSRRSAWAPTCSSTP